MDTNQSAQPQVRTYKRTAIILGVICVLTLMAFLFAQVLLIDYIQLIHQGKNTSQEAQTETSSETGEDTPGQKDSPESGSQAPFAWLGVVFGVLALMVSLVIFVPLFLFPSLFCLPLSLKIRKSPLRPVRIAGITEAVFYALFILGGIIDILVFFLNK